MMVKWLDLSEAVHRIAQRIDGESDKARQSAASDDLYKKLGWGQVRSRAGRVFAEKPGTWALANWPILPALWQVVAVYPNFAVTWAWPANESKPDGWPADGAVKLTGIEVSLADINRTWPVPTQGAERRPSLTSLTTFLRGY